MSDTKFSYLQVEAAASSQDREVSLRSLIESSDALAEEAREVLPYSFDECTYAKGYLRQAIWACVDCGEKGVCYGCSISCHAEHKLVELWTKRHFRCDCPTSSTSSKCTITPGHQQPQEPNEENTYSHNFQGEFCRCGRNYDPETETEAMIQCIACEDWYHETCLNLRSSDTQPEGDEEDDETRVLIPSDTYDGLICRACVGGNKFLETQAGSGGFMIIVPSRDGGYEVVGREEDALAGSNEGGAKRDRGDEETPEGRKKLRMDDPNIDAAGDVKTDTSMDQATPSIPLPAQVDSALAKEEKPVFVTEKKIESATKKQDIFLAHGIRERLQAELDTTTIASLPFDLIDREIYEPPQDDDEDETLEQVTSRVMSNLPRVQAIEAVHGYQNMKLVRQFPSVVLVHETLYKGERLIYRDKLLSMLRGHEANGETVKKEDIDNFFAGLKGGRA